MIQHKKPQDLPAEHRAGHDGYEYFRRTFVPRGDGQCVVAMYTILPGKSAFPYHYHTKNEEVYYIVSGSGTLRTPDGERSVTAGDLLHFPANESGAHKLTNTSSDELVYIDFDTSNDLEVTVYPDSGKLGVWGKGINKLYRTDDDVGYFDGE